MYKHMCVVFISENMYHVWTIEEVIEMQWFSFSFNDHLRFLSIIYNKRKIERTNVKEQRLKGNTFSRKWDEIFVRQDSPRLYFLPFSYPNTQHKTGTVTLTKESWKLEKDTSAALSVLHRVQRKRRNSKRVLWSRFALS